MLESWFVSQSITILFFIFNIKQVKRLDTMCLKYICIFPKAINVTCPSISQVGLEICAVVLFLIVWWYSPNIASIWFVLWFWWFAILQLLHFDSVVLLEHCLSPNVSFWNEFIEHMPVLCVSLSPHHLCPVLYTCHLFLTSSLINSVVFFITDTITPLMVLIIAVDFVFLVLFLF